MFPPVASSLHRVYHSKKRNPKSPKILDSRTKRCDNKRGLIILARGQKKKGILLVLSSPHQRQINQNTSPAFDAAWHSQARADANYAGTAVDQSGAAAGSRDVDQRRVPSPYAQQGAAYVR